MGVGGNWNRYFQDLKLINWTETRLSTFFSINRKYKNLKNEKYNYVQRKSGKETKWCALDTGKVVINLFLEDQRKYYDLESLWSCGIEFDEKYIEFTKNKSDIEKRLIVPDEEQTQQN